MALGEFSTITLLAPRLSAVRTPQAQREVRLASRDVSADQEEATLATLLPRSAGSPHFSKDQIPFCSFDEAS